MINFLVLIPALIFLLIYLCFFLWIWKGLSSASAKDAMVTAGAGTIPFSIIIAAHNEENFIEGTLQSILQQEYPPEKFEVILVADRCTDATVEIANKIRPSFRHFKLIEITEVPVMQSPKKHAIQQGLESAEHQHFILMDADCTVPRSCFRIFRHYFAAGYQAVVSIPKFAAGFSRLYAYLLPERLVTWGIAAASVGFSRPFLAFGTLWGYTRRAYQEVGGMTEISHALSGDDDLLVYLLGQKKLPVAFCLKPEGWGTTRIPESLREFVIQRRRHHSAGKFYGRKIQLGYLLYHLSNLFLWILPLIQPYMLPILVFKIVLDYALLIRLGKIFREGVSLFNLIIFEAGYLLHHLFIAPLAFLGKIRWR